MFNSSGKYNVSEIINISKLFDKSIQLLKIHAKKKKSIRSVLIIAL